MPAPRLVLEQILKKAVKEMGIQRKKNEKTIQDVKSVFCMKFYRFHSFSLSMRADVKADIQFMSDSAAINNANE